MKSSNQESNFWISYADLMAGLLFVFILLIGAIVSKSIILRSDLNTKEKKLKVAVAELAKNERELEIKRDILEQSQKRLKDLESELNDRKRALLLGNSKIDKQSLLIAKQQRELLEAKDRIKLQADEVKKLHLLLAELNSKNRDLSSRVDLADSKNRDLESNQSRLIKLYESKLELKESELKKLNWLLMSRNTKIDNLNSKIVVLQNLLTKNEKREDKKKRELKDYEDRVLILSKHLDRTKKDLKLKSKELSSILDALENQKSQYESLLMKLRMQRAQIKSLTGIRLKLIDELKETLGSKIKLDRASGALSLSSKILFDKGSSSLKEEAKKELKSVFEEYISSLMNNRAVAPYIDRIIIEGHTDSDGGYLYNLKLSQERALAVMNYLLSLPISKKYKLKNYLVASGRAYMDRVIRGGKEDKDASRRIEIKFSLKNQEAMYEIERILDADKEQ